MPASRRVTSKLGLQRALPDKLLASGFGFGFDVLNAALHDLLADDPARARQTGGAMNKASDRPLGGMVFEAIEFAARAHAGQVRKGTRLPYIIHPLSVARILIEQDQPDTTVVVGILHDTIEDTQVTREDIEADFGSEVADLVAAVSEPDKDLPWEDRKRGTLETIRSGPEAAVWVELADKLDNVRSLAADHARLGDRVWDRFRRPKKEQRWYYDALRDALAKRMEAGSGARLAAAFGELVEKVFFPRR